MIPAEVDKMLADLLRAAKILEEARSDFDAFKWPKGGQPNVRKKFGGKLASAESLIHVAIRQLQGF